MATEAAALEGFYAVLSPRSKRLFRPLGWNPMLSQYEAVARGNEPGVDSRLDLVAAQADGHIIGWCFVQNLRTDRPSFGLAVADDRQRQGVGRALMARLFAQLGRYALRQVYLTVVKDNAVAQHLYESFGFRTYDETVSKDDGLTYLCMVNTSIVPTAPPRPRR
jgi:ribosomal protein S18 acetylase RimI-like enzyme